MGISDERIQKLTEVLSADKEEGQKLIDMSPEEAVAAINAKGYDFSVEELKSFAEKLKNVMQKKDELSEEDLVSVAGGMGVGATIGVACLIAFGTGVAVGGLEKLFSSIGW